MGIGSVGIGSSILTQDVLDQLRKADEAGQITPIKLSLANESDKKEALKIVEASMKNLTDSINEIKNHSLFDERKTIATGAAVEVTAQGGSDIQDFTLTVDILATKQIEQSGKFASDSVKVATAAGSMNLNIGGKDFVINYDETTTLKDLKNRINEVAGEKVNATLVQIAGGDTRLFLSSLETGANRTDPLKTDEENSVTNITITDTSGNLSNDGGTTAGGTSLTTGLTAIQNGTDATFKFNGQAITRASNNVDDLVSGLTIKLKEPGTSVVSISQDRENIMGKFDSFVAKYNAAISELNKLTKSSIDSKERGIFSGESTIKSMKSALQSLTENIGGGVAIMADFGFDISKDGVMSLNKTKLNEKIDNNPKNVEAFFAGGTYTNTDLSTKEVTGSFTEMSNVVEGYTKYNATLDLFKTSITENISALESRKESATEKLDARYERLKKQFIAYDMMISKINSTSSMFVQMANAQIAGQNR